MNIVRSVIRSVKLSTRVVSIRPIIQLSELENCYAMIDSGAIYPVWTKDEDILRSLPNVKSTGKQRTISGFGGEQLGNLYSLPVFIGEFCWPDIPVTCCPLKGMRCDLILPMSMFHGMNVTISTVDNYIQFDSFDNQPVRHLKEFDDNGNLYTLRESVSEQTDLEMLKSSIF